VPEIVVVLVQAAVEKDNLGRTYTVLV